MPCQNFIAACARPHSTSQRNKRRSSSCSSTRKNSHPLECHYNQQYYTQETRPWNYYLPNSANPSYPGYNPNCYPNHPGYNPQNPGNSGYNPPYYPQPGYPNYPPQGIPIQPASPKIIPPQFNALLQPAFGFHPQNPEYLPPQNTHPAIAPGYHTQNPGNSSYNPQIPGAAPQNHTYSPPPRYSDVFPQQSASSSQQPQPNPGYSQQSSNPGFLQPSFNPEYAMRPMSTGAIPNQVEREYSQQAAPIAMNNAPVPAVPQSDMTSSSHLYTHPYTGAPIGFIGSPASAVQQPQYQPNQPYLYGQSRYPH